MRDTPVTAVKRLLVPELLIPNGEQSPLEETSGIKTAHLRWLVLTPVMAIIFALIGILVASSYRHESDDISRQVKTLRVSAAEVYQDNLEHLTGMLGGITGVLTKDDELRSAIGKKDRAKLEDLIMPIFANLQQDYEISYFYVMGPDRTVLLRAHDLGRNGDVINRATMLKAQSSHEPAHGVEMGIDGILALRFVNPIYEDKAKQHLIGFVELGLDIGHLLKDIQQSLAVQMFQLHSKEFVKRDQWERGMAALGKPPEWDLFKDMVLTPQALTNLTPAMGTIMAKRTLPEKDGMMEVSLGESAFRAVSLPIQDIEEHSVGEIIMLVDVTPQVLSVRHTLYLGLISGIVGGGSLFGFFWFLTGRVGRLIERHQQTLHHLATRDGLTGLFNHFTFYKTLEDEVVRSKRYVKPVSILMLDLDYFKEINDKYGHPNGDRVLTEFAQMIQRLARPIDKICRYGGEEVAVILPETNGGSAALLAERLRAAVATHVFKLNEGQEVSVTVSIGVGSDSTGAASAQDLVSLADQALYRAKERGRNQVCI